MKILFITKTLKPVSGWGRMSFLLTEEAKRHNCVASDISEDDELLPITILNFVKNVWRVRRRSKGFNIVHALDGWPYGIYGYLAVVGTKKKLFINGIGTYSVAAFNSFLKGFFLGMSYRRAKKVFCISKYTQKRILKKIRLRNTEVVYLGKTDFLVEKYDKAKNINSNNFPVLLTVGAVKERKGQFYVLRAVKMLKKKYPNIIYNIVGFFENEKYVKDIKKYTLDNNLENNIRFIRDVKNDRELYDFYKNCDVFLLCSVNTGDHFEGFGLVLIEAASLGKPVIGSLDNGTEEAVKDGYNGYLVRQRNSQDIYDKLVLILEGDRESMSASSKLWANEFSWEKTVDEYIKFYKE